MQILDKQDMIKEESDEMSIETLVDMLNDKLSSSTQKYSFVKKKIKELELALLQVKQNTTIPEISLTVDPKIIEWINGKKDVEELIKDAPFLNKIQSDVNSWIKEIQRVTLLTRDPSEGNTRQEIEFWLQMEASLSQIESQLKAKEIVYTLDVLKSAKRFHATVSFIADTGIKDCMEMVLKYNLLMKDFPINDLLSAPDFEKIRDAIEAIFTHFTKKLKISPYPVRRALPLAERISQDMTNQIMSIMPPNLLSIPYSYFLTLMKQATLIFDTWDECVKEFVSVCRDVSRKRSEKFIPVKVVAKHAALQERITYVHNFRLSHHQLVATIEKVVSTDYSKSSLDDLGIANAAAIVQVNSAMEAIKSVNVLDVSPEGTKLWSLAEESYTEKISVIEHSISTHLQSRLEVCKSAGDMFRVFAKFNVLFVRPKIRGAIHEYQTRLVDRVKDDIKKLHERFMKDSNREALLITKGRDIPSLSGSIIWAKGIERQLGEYMKKVENVLGKGWQMYAQGQQLEKEEVAFRKQLDTKALFQQWVKEETSRKPVAGKIFAIKRNKLRGNQLELDINFDSKSIGVFKDVRNLIWLGFSVPIQIQNIAKDSKRVYPFAVSLDETLRIYRKTLVKVEQNPPIRILVANYHATIQTLIAKGTQLRWEYFTGITATENRQSVFVRDLASAVTTFQEKTFSALQYCQAIEVSVGELSSVKYDHGLLSACLETIQANVDKLNFESLANLEQWNAGLDARIETALLGRLTDAIKETTKGECFKVAQEHSLQIQNQSIFLDPPLENARMNWLKTFNEWTGVVTSLPKVKVFAYGRNKLDVEQPLTYSKLLQRVKPELLQSVYAHIESMFSGAAEYVGNWLKYQSLWDLQSSIIFDVLGDDLQLWCSTISEVKAERSTFDTTKTCHALQAINIHYGNVQTKVSAVYDQWQRDLLQQFSFVLRSSLVSMNEVLAQSRLALEKSTLSATKDMIDLVIRIKDLNLKFAGWSDKMKNCHDAQRLLERQRFQFPSDWLFYEQVHGEYSAFEEILKLKSLYMSEQRTTLELRVNQESDIVNNQISDFLREWNVDKPIDGLLSPANALLALGKFQKDANSLQSKFQEVQEAKNAIDLARVLVDPLEVVQEEIEDLIFVWKSLVEVWNIFESIKCTPWLSKDCLGIKMQLENLLSVLNKMPNKVRQYNSYQTMLENVANSLKLHNGALFLKSECLRERHWMRILSIAKIEVSASALTVDMVWSASGFKKNEKAIEEIVLLAQGEMSLEEFLNQVKLVWDNCQFEYVNFQNKCRLVKGWDDLFSKCQDHLSALSAMKNSVHYKAFKSSAALLEDSLSRLYSILEVWVKVQRQWVYLQGIFNDNQEMKLVLPMESSRFASVDGEFMTVLRKVYKTPLVFDAVSIPNILQTMERLHELLNGIQKSLGEYLESERSNFARFYFISDDDLLEILGNSKDVRRIEPHMKKMFPAIHGFVLSPDSINVVGVLSKEGERIEFKTPISTKGRVYAWLSQVERQVKNSLQLLLSEALKDSRTHYLVEICSSKAFLDLVNSLPAQILILASQIHWTDMLESCFGSFESLKNLASNVSNFIAMLTEIVVLNIDRLARRKIEALITELVYQRDVIREARDSKIKSNKDFFWLSHLRVYAEKENVVVRMGNSSFNYGFEYLGLQEKLVQTPLTDRCYLTLTQALKNKLGGSPFGPAGTGKTESVKALASQLGRHCLVFCCDDGFDFRSMGRIFTGLAKVGAWGCFDEFNRLEESILSAVSQQIQEIQSGLRDGRIIDLIGKQTQVDENTGIFITMNPGYAGRSLLPNNLTTLFRAVSMTAPDRELIAEVMLFSQGFHHAEYLASKAIPFFDILKEQLSKQKHYDFGLRALKNVLVSAGKLQREKILSLDKQAFDERQEELTMVKSIEETVFPKLVKNDIVIAERLLENIFDAQKAAADESKLVSVLLNLCDEFHLVSDAEFIQKIIQLNTIQQISHGCMVVGLSGSGKTAAWKLLFKALEKIRGENGFVHVIEPKTVSKGKLFGSMDHTTRDWTDGIFTKILRDIINDERGHGSKTHWIVFDGEVDPDWIENLNSVLDDNKMLTLPNGERLHFPPNARIIFEVESLDRATPATVSRCGMVWFPEGLVTPKMLSSRYISMLKNHSVERLGSTLNLEFFDKASVFIDDSQSLTADILDKYFCKNGFVELCLVKALELEHVMVIRPIQALENLFALLSFSIRQVVNYNDSHPDFPLSKDQIETFITKSLFVHIGWAFAGGLGKKEQTSFGEFVAKSGNLRLGTNFNSVFDVHVDLLSGQWVPWSSSVPTINVDSNAVTRHDLVIPTADTLKHESILYAWMSEHRSLILCGPPGSGKTMSLLASLRNLPNIDVVSINFSSETSYDFVIKTLELHCSYKKLLGREILTPKIDGHWVVLFCDEINLPKPDAYGTQRVVSFLRQLVEQKGFWRSDLVWISVENIQIVGACNPPTDSGRIVLSARFLRHSPVIYVDYPGEESLVTIYGTLSRACLQNHPTLRAFAEPVTNAMIDLYMSVKSELTSDKWAHYIFSPRELTRWIRGIHEYLVQTDYLNLDDLVRIWAHEAFRLFQDRIADDVDRNFLDSLVSGMALKHFPGVNMDVALQTPILFSNFLSKSYQSSDRSQLIEFVQSKLQVYYEEELNIPLVLFDAGLDHILRIDRVFRQVQGHLLMIGLSGSGKSTLTRFVCWMNGISFYQPAMHSKYSITDFEDDLRIVLKRAGCKGESICFMMDEANILDSSFLERINTLLANAEIPGLFEGDDFTALMAACKEGSTREGLSLDGHDRLNQWFSNQIAKNLHIVFSMNPPNSITSIQTTSSPALFNRCVLNWMGDWNEQAFFEVGKALTVGVDLSQPFKCPASFIPSTSYLNGSLTYEETVVDTLAYCHFTCRNMLKSIQSAQAFVNPKQFVDFCHLFTTIYLEKRAELENRQRHVIVGLERLQETLDKVSELRSSLSLKNAELEKKSNEANEKLKKMVADQQFAENKRSMSLSIKQSLAEKNVQIAQRRRIVKEDLDLAEPAVIAAQESVSSIKKQHLTELRSMGNPPNAVKLAMESVCILLGHKAESWKSVQAVLRRDDFISSIVNYDTSKLSNSLRKVVTESYIQDPSYTFDNANRASKACGPLVNWAIAQVAYADILEKVEPLREELASLEESAKTTEKEAEDNQSLVEKLESSIAIYKEEYAVLISAVQALKAEMAAVKDRVDRSVKVLSNLSTERERWSQSKESFGTLMKTLVGDSLLASSFISYAGIFDQSNRHVLIQRIKSRLREAGIEFQNHLSLPDYLTSESERSGWYKHNLPTDSLCVENAIMLEKSLRYPLIIDPSGQAVTFLKSYYKSKSMAITSFRDPAFLKVLESALRFGNPILIEDAENFDCIINGILNKEIRRSGGRNLCRLGKKEVDYSSNFKLFLSTKNEGHRFPPNLSSKVNFINFTITRDSLQSQCLTKFLLSERPDIESKRRDLLRMQGEYQLRLHKLEKLLLDALNKSTGNILDDEEVLHNLETLKTEACEISAKVAETDSILTEVESVTFLYEPLAEMCSAIYFCVESFSAIQNLYQFSLAQFFAVFDQILKIPVGAVDRISMLKESIMQQYFKAASSFLWYEDTYLLALMFARVFDESFDKGWSLFLDPNIGEKSVLQYQISDLSLEASSRLAHFAPLRSFTRLKDKLDTRRDLKLSAIIRSAHPEAELEKILSKLDVSFNGFHRLILLQCLRPDRMLNGISSYVGSLFGNDFLNSGLESKIEELLTVPDENLKWSSFLLVNKKGLDIGHEVERLATKNKQVLYSIALGSSESAQQIDAAITKGIKNGSWVLVKNAHLAIDWLVSFANHMPAITFANKFRLFITMEPHERIPVNLIRLSSVMVFEPPVGVKQSLMQLLGSIPKTLHTAVPAELARLVFMLAWLHSVVTERSRYAPIGWTKNYDFNFSDFEMALSLLISWVQENSSGRSNISIERIPWEAIQNLLSRTVYGGKIDRVDDQTLMDILVAENFNPLIFDSSFLLVRGRDDSEFLKAPVGVNIDTFIEWTSSLNDEQSPHWISLPQKSNLLLKENQGNNLLCNLRKITRVWDSDEHNERSQTVLQRNLEDWMEFMPKGALRLWARPSTTIMDKFYEKEFADCRALMETVKTDLNNLLSYFTGELSLTSHIHLLIQALSQGVSPWDNSQSKPATFLRSLAIRWNALCCKAESSAGPIPLDAISDVKGLLIATREEFAVKLSASLEKLTMTCTLLTSCSAAGFEIAGLSSQCCIVDEGKIRIAEEVEVKPFPNCVIYWSIPPRKGMAKIPVYQGLERDSVLFYLDTADLTQAEVSKLGVALVI